MTDRSVTVTIGAVLASTFRSSFREAQREVTALSRSLDTLGGRRSNAGLSSVREGSTAARLALRGLRTEIGATVRVLDSMPAHATRSSAVLRTMAGEARSAAAGVGSLNTALRGLDRGSSATSLGRMNTAARASATGTRQLRTEASALSRGLLGLDRRLNSTTSALGRYSVAARTASSAAGGLTRSTANTGNTFATAAQHIQGASSAVSHMTSAINAQTAAQGRLNTATRNMPRGGGAGGGGAGHGFGGGAHMPIGAHAGLHAAFGAVGGGILAGKLVHGVWENASDYAHQIAMRKVQGWNGEEIAQLKRQATAISSMVGNISDREILKTAGHLQLAFGDREEALRHLGALTQSTSLLKFATPDLNGEENSYGMVKALEQMGRAKDPANFDSLVERLTAATIASGGKFNGQALFQMVGRSGTAAANISDNFLTTYMPSLIQELGGSQAGNTLAMVRSALIGGRMTRGAAQTWDSLGLLDHSKSDASMSAPGTAGHGNIRMAMHGHVGRFTGTQMGKAGVVDGELLQSDPGTWVQKHLVGALHDHKISDPKEIGTMMAQLFSNKSAERMMSILLLQSARLEKDAGLIKAAEGNLANYGLNAGDIHGAMSKEEINATIRNDPTFALQRLETQWENFTSRGVWQQMMVPAAQALNLVGDALQRLSTVNPDVARQFVEVGAAMVGVPSAFWAASTAMRFFTSGWTSLIGMAANPWFLGVAGAGYLIWKNWDWVSGFATGAAPGFMRALDRIGAGFDWVVDRGEDLLRFFGLIPAKTDTAASAFGRGEAAGRALGGVFTDVLEAGAVLFATSGALKMVSAIGRITGAISGVNAAAGGGFFARMFGAAGAGRMAMLGRLGIVGAAAMAGRHLEGLDTPAGQKEEDRVSRLPWGQWFVNKLDPGLERSIYGAPKDDPDQRTQWQRMAPSFLGGKPAPAAPGAAPGGNPAAAAPSAAPRAPLTATGRDPRRMGPTSSEDGNGGMFGGLFHRSAYVTYDNDNDGAASDMAGAASRSDASTMLRSAVRLGVIDGLRAVLNPGATSGGFVNASFESGFGGGAGGAGGGGSFGGGHSSPSIRFGRQHSGSGLGEDVGGTASRMSGDVAARAKSAMARLEAKGWTHEAAAAAIGNAQQESGVRSDGPLGDTARFGTGDDAAHGMFQWRGSRFRALKAFAGQRGTSWQDFNTQVDFFDEESRRYGSADWRTSHSILDANRGMKRFEGYGDDSFGTRLANARQLAAGRSDGASYAPEGGSTASNLAGNAGAAGAVDTAMNMRGFGSRQSAAALGSKMTDGEWCADFVNGALQRNGVRGSGSSMALSFKTWGEAVPGGVNGVRKGDVLTEDHGRGHGHAMMATGNVRRDSSGRVTGVEVISGNHGNKVGTAWESPGEIASIRRAAEAKQAIAGAAASSGRRAAAGGGGGGVTVHAPITINPHPHQSPADIGKEAAGHVRDARSDGARLRSQMYDWTA